MENKLLLDRRLKDELCRLYGAAGRHYHDASHIEALLGLADAYKGLLTDPEAVEAAIWFHDAIYDSRSSDNEQRSAALARKKLAGRVSQARLERITRMIEATATHAPPDLGDAAANADAALFVDMDLSILGAPPDVFDAYEAAIRREYDWVDGAAWRKGRGDVLRRFADRPRIFSSETFRQRFEAAARQNLERALLRLSNPA